MFRNLLKAVCCLVVLESCYASLDVEGFQKFSYETPYLFTGTEFQFGITPLRTDTPDGGPEASPGGSMHYKFDMQFIGEPPAPIGEMIQKGMEMYLEKFYKEQAYLELNQLADQISASIPFLEREGEKSFYTDVCTRLKKSLVDCNFKKEEIVQLGAFKFCLAFVMENSNSILELENLLGEIIAIPEVNSMLSTFTSGSSDVFSTGQKLMDSIADGENVYYNAAVYRGTDQ